MFEALSFFTQAPDCTDMPITAVGAFKLFYVSRILYQEPEDSYTRALLYEQLNYSGAFIEST